MGWFDWLPFGKQRRERTEKELAELRHRFVARYHSFKLLLSANTRMHDLIAETEEALRGVHPYGMHYVRALCSRMSVATFQMIRHLRELGPGKYDNLVERFKDIQAEIEPYIQAVRRTADGPLVVRIRGLGREDTDSAGSKMSMLGEIKNALGLKVPTGFVATAAAFWKFMEASGLSEEIDRLIQATDHKDRSALLSTSEKIIRSIMDAPLPEDLSAALTEARDRLVDIEGGDVPLAVRSSALGEDLEGTSFAGQYRSLLNVEPGDLLAAYKEVVASKYTPQAMAYRVNRGILDEDVAMSVGFMAMVDAAASGVAYTSSPVDVRDDRVHINAVQGLPKGVVDGSVDSDQFWVDPKPPHEVLDKRIVAKPHKYVCLPGRPSCTRVDVDDPQAPALTDEQASLVGRMAQAMDDYFGSPQDVEWAITDDGEFHLLQCRPLMQLDPSEMRAEHRPLDSQLPEPLMAGGETASPGVGMGPAHPIRKEEDVLTFPDGGVLIVRMALPARAALLDRCSAVVAEHGGIAGHLANVAREFGVPALFGVPGALDSLEPGTIVTVDADGRKIYPGAIDELAVPVERRNLMRGSPVQAALRGAARSIIRLRLLDPDSKDFRPRNCRTYHDIMRFCHEMAVREMFEFGTDDDTAMTMARQLICDVPMQFWLLDLDNGVDPANEGEADSCVMIEYVRSLPMLALWEGMRAVPWAGPPPVHTRGLLSVMFEATANPDLEPSGHSQYANKNYFMISRNYCSLQSRFGFHFCGVEAVVGDRPTENYASFQFKGGAANLERRSRRTRFIAEILEAFDFRVRLRGDNLVARVEALDKPDMVHRLKILGYLITHTRQLDMIMTDEAAIEKHRAKMMADLVQFKADDPEAAPGRASGN